MSNLIAIFFAIFFTLTSSLGFPAVTWAATNSPLADCPSSPNCVVSLKGDEKHAIDPISYSVDQNTAKETLIQVLGVIPRTEVVEETDNYIHALSKSRIFHFTDDVEFYLPENEKVIHFRSASRVGESDLGVNRRRMEQIRLALQDLGI